MLFTTLSELYEHYLLADQKICTDTRKMESGALFFALKGDRFNANEFAGKALEAGCAYAIIDDERYYSGNRTLLVSDVLTSLQELASHHRKQLKIPVLAITGSNGKTTNKELIAAVLGKKYNTLATFGNLNNHIGVPLTLLSLRAEHEFAVIEMGANHQGEIAQLCGIAQPDFGLITNVGKAHLEGFGGMEGVKKGKGELYDFLRERNAKAFVNGDDPVLYEMAFHNDKITYGCKKLYDVIGKDCNNSETVSLKYTTRYGEKDFNKIPVIKTHIFGNYNLVNCLAAACIGNYFKVEDQQIREALENYIPSMNRSQIVRTEKNTLVLDAYNANPNSMKAAIENFSKHPATEKYMLLGDMFELGEFSAAEHQELVNFIKEKKLENVLLVGKEFFNSQANGYPKFMTVEECRVYLSEKKITGATILIKGSRGMKMESLQDLL